MVLTERLGGGGGKDPGQQRRVLLHAGTESLGHSEHRDIGVPRPDTTGEKNVPVHRAENEKKKRKEKEKKKKIMRKMYRTPD